MRAIVLGLAVILGVSCGGPAPRAKTVAKRPSFIQVCAAEPEPPPC